jgi:hypothetical protein
MMGSTQPLEMLLLSIVIMELMPRELLFMGMLRCWYTPGFDPASGYIEFWVDGNSRPWGQDGEDVIETVHCFPAGFTVELGRR